MTDTQAAVAAALMQAAEVVYQFFDALSFDDEWSLEDLQAAILALIDADAMAALEAVKAANPQAALYYQNVVKGEKTGEHDVTFTFDMTKVPTSYGGLEEVYGYITLTPLTALAAAELAIRAGIPAGVINLLSADSNHSIAIGKVLCESGVVRHLSFTGSTEVGRILMAQSAPTVKKLSLELGGNAPFIVFDDADIDSAVDIEWAIATRFQADRDLLVVSGAQGSRLDPSSQEGVSAKMGLDATVPLGGMADTYRRIRVPGEEDVDLGAALEQGPERAAGAPFRARLEVPPGQDERHGGGRDLEVQVVVVADASDQRHRHRHAVVARRGEEQRVGAPPERGEHAEYGARCADAFRPRDGHEPQPAKAAKHAADEIHGQKMLGAHGALGFRAQKIQREHVEEQMGEAAMQKHVGDRLPEIPGVQAGS